MTTEVFLDQPDLIYARIDWSETSQQHRPDLHRPDYSILGHRDYMNIFLLLFQITTSMCRKVIACGILPFERRSYVGFFFKNKEWRTWMRSEERKKERARGYHREIHRRRGVHTEAAKEKTKDEQLIMYNEVAMWKTWRWKEWTGQSNVDGKTNSWHRSHRHQRRLLLQCSYEDVASLNSMHASSNIS